ncbi:hypothetical protein H072_110 [Dactylellina haptotyla CBS 200.50]|uniref:NACHT domain-containing protein n=1 Tax=Dactylellina haptotyla (strain CBS 200.50) TaxID=1284197 RepID=S8CE12_DACHA|nr:hypothetical protein H072_110 [Dactylellina haptotyla CBS 200.50]
MVIAYKENPDVGLRCKGVIFLGTPHQGSAAAQIAKVMAKSVNKPTAYLGVKLFAGEIRADLLEDLMYDSPKLSSISKTFKERAAVLKIFSFYESERIGGQVIVTRSSAILNVPHEKYAPLYADHRDICRFENAESDNLKKVLRVIVDMADEIAQQRNSRSILTTDSEISLDDLEKDCMEQLNTIDIAAARQANLERFVEGTLQWLRLNNRYCNWESSGNASLLWVTGPPGCGKTVLSSYVSEAISKSATGSTILCQFFCNSSVKERHEPTFILRSIIHQIVLRRWRLLKLVRRARSLQGPKLFQQQSGLWDLLVDILKAAEGSHIFIIIDALDECDEATQAMFVNRITGFIEQAGDSAAKFLITSRPRTSAYFGLPSDESIYPRLDLEEFQESIGQDVLRVIRRKLDSMVQKDSCSKDLRLRLENSLTSKAEKTFLWVSLVISSLEEKPIILPADVTMLQNLPPNLSVLYKQLLEAIPASSRELAGQLLRIIVCSQRSMEVEEINLLTKHLAEPDEETDHPVYTSGAITRLLHPFVRVSGNQVALIHKSVADFLLDLGSEESDEIARAFGVNLHRDSLIIVNACMRYLLSNSFSSDLFSDSGYNSESEQGSEATSPFESSPYFTDDWISDPDGFGFDDFRIRLMSSGGLVSDDEYCKKISREYKLFDYASTFWNELFSKNIEFSKDALQVELQNMAIDLLDRNNVQTTNWLRYYWAVTKDSDDALPENSGSLALASYFGHKALLQRLFNGAESGQEVGEAIHWAATRGNSLCLKGLLEQYTEKISNDLRVCYLKGLPPLAAAAKHGHLDCVAILLDQKIFDIDATDENGQTALSLAIMHGHEKIVNMLLDQEDIDPNLPDRSSYTPLFWITSCGSLSILSKLLKDKRVNARDLDRKGRNPLSWAAEEGQYDLVKQMILDGRMDPNNRDLSGRTPLLWAVQNMHLSVVKLLIEKGKVDISSRDKSGRNAISWAVERNDKTTSDPDSKNKGNNSLLNYLIKKCPHQVDVPDEQGWAPLAWALNPPGYLDNALLLLQSGRVNINLLDRTGRSPLSFAVGWGYPRLAEAFLRFPGINPNCVDREGNTPIFEAVRMNSVEMIKVLVSAGGVDLCFKNKSGQTPFAVAQAEGKLEIAKLLPPDVVDMDA